MEGVFVSALSKYGTIPVLLLILAIVWILLSNIYKQQKEILQTVRDNRSDILSKIEGLDNKVTAEIKEMLDRIGLLEARVRDVEKEYVSRAEMCRSLGGWRTEILSLNRRLDDLIREVVKSVGK